MISHAINAEVTASIHERTTAWLGLWSSILTAITTAAALGIAVTTLPRSGPFCQVEPCVRYPYTDAAAFVPADYIWMYPAFFIGPLFVILMVCIHYYAPHGKKLFSQIALAFAIIAATALAGNYFIQLTVMQPSFVKGEVEGLSLFSQYNPHGIFIALEDISYLIMSLAFLFAAPVFDQPARLDRTIRIIFGASALLSIGAFIVLASIYGMDLEYRYEVTSILIAWSALIVLGILLGFLFLRTDRAASSTM